MKGLEVCEVLYSEAIFGTETSRIDPEYFNRVAMTAMKLIKGGKTIGDLVLEGYRVVYETTRVIDREEGDHLGLPYFLQSTNITTPFIRADSMNCVAESDWARYPKGRILPGEILIEVKGKAEKIALVPDDFPSKTLVTGTCFKLTTKLPEDRYFLAAYLVGKYGQALKDRLKTNLLVAYIAKNDLYGLPVPEISKKMKLELQKIFEEMFHQQKSVINQKAQIERHLTEMLGLESWSPTKPLSYIRSCREVFATERLDAEYQHPKYDALRNELSKRFKITTLSSLGQITKGTTVKYSENGNIPIIRSGDLRDINNEDNLLASSSIEPIFYLENGDVLISSIGFGSIGKVQVFNKEGKYGTVGEVTVIRQDVVNPFYLAAFLSSLAGQMQIEQHITGATGQLHLYPRDVANFWVPLLPAEAQVEFENLALKTQEKNQRINQLLNSAKRAVDLAIEDSETAALAYLKGVM